MLYLNYAKQVAGIGYILNFFADSEKDIEEVSGGKSFISNNGINYGAPLSSSTIVITYPDKTKKTYVLYEDGNWYAGGANPGSKVEVNTKNWDIHYPELETISVDGETYRTDNVSVNQNAAGQSVTKLENLVLNGKYYGITNDGVTSIGGVKGDITLGPQLKISNKEISVNIEANAATTQDTPELTSLKIADNVYKIPTNNNANNNVLILEGELFKYNSSDENYNIKVKVSSYQEGKTIADRFKKGDTIRVFYNTGSVVRTGDIVYCEDYTWCDNMLQWIYLYAMSSLTPDRNTPADAPSVVQVVLELAE